MHENGNPYIHLVALQGSVRPGNYTARALALVADEVEKHPSVSLEIVDPTEMHLPLPGQGSSDDAKRMQETVAAATGVILATPEYHGPLTHTAASAPDSSPLP